jgi:succinate dehydrogenase subunit C
MSSVDDLAPLYRRPVSLFWSARRGSYLLFVLRELSSVAVAWTVVYLLLMVNAVFSGADAYQRFLDWSGSPWLILINVVALLFLLLHAVTWFNLAPQAIVVRLKGRRVPARLRGKLVPPRLVAAAHFGAWLVASALVALIVLGVG